MDTLCGLGLPELIIIILVGFVVIGPQRSRELAVSTGRMIRRVMRSQWWREFNQVTTALRDLPNTLVRMAELEDDLRKVRTDLSKAAQVDSSVLMGEHADKSQDLRSDLDPWGVGAPDEASDTGETAPILPEDEPKQ